MTYLPSSALRVSRSALLLVACLATFMLGGCDRVGPALDLTGQVEQIPPRPITEELLRVVLPQTGVEATLGLISQRDDVAVWQTLDGITVTFRQGVLIATRGLGDDLMSSDVDNTLIMLKGGPSQEYYPQIRSYLDGEDQTQFRAYQCRQSDLSMQQSSMGSLSRNLKRVTEHCVSTDGEVTNTYWLDPAGTVVRSRQWVRPDVGYIETERVQQ